MLLACQGQLRLGPSGHLVGIDMSAALKIAASRGCNLTVLSELLPAAEAGIVEPCVPPGVARYRKLRSDPSVSSWSGAPAQAATRTGGRRESARSWSPERR